MKARPRKGGGRADVAKSIGTVSVTVPDLGFGREVGREVFLVSFVSSRQMFPCLCSHALRRAHSAGS